MQATRVHDWNVVITLRDGGIASAKRLLRPFGRAERSGFFNVLVMHVEDARAMLEALGTHPAGEGEVLSRVMPATHTFDFASVEEFEQRGRHLAEELAPALAGKSFHVRMHRRGFKGHLSSHQEERLLDAALLDALGRAGNPGRITFEDPDVIVSGEIVGPRAGFAIWTREERARYPLLRLD